jgi:hypothetical protein
MERRHSYTDSDRWAVIINTMGLSGLLMYAGTARRMQ